MPVNPKVIAELRAMFKDGATPSRLMQHIYRHHGGDRGWHGLVQDYFAEAFHVPWVRVTNRSADYADASDLRHAHFNVHLLHKMIENRTKWDQDIEPGNCKAWLNPLDATDQLQSSMEVQPKSLPELVQVWDQLDASAQHYVEELIGTTNALYERVLILSRLAERLQQRILAQESSSIDEAVTTELHAVDVKASGVE